MLAGLLSSLLPSAVSTIGNVVGDLFHKGMEGKIHSFSDFGRELLNSGKKALIGSAGEASPLLKGVKAAVSNIVNDRPVFSSNSIHGRTLYPGSIPLKNETMSEKRAQPQPSAPDYLEEPVFVTTTENIHGTPKETTILVEGSRRRRRRRRRQ